jgi:transposase
MEVIMGLRNILNIPVGYKMTKLEETPETLEIYIEPYKNKKAICSGCGGIHTEGYHGVEVMKVRDLPVVKRKVNLHVSKRRYRCPRDGKIYVEYLEWAKKKADIPLDLLKLFIV